MNISIIGLGNVLMSDDGFGPYVVRLLEASYAVPPNVQIVDAGTPGLDLIPYLLGADAVIFVDTEKGAGTAGDINVYRKSEILARPAQPPPSPHDARVRDALVTVARAGKAPAEVLLVGVNPEWIATGVTLSAPVRSAVAPAVGLILTELDRFGARATLRAVPRQPDTWWEAPAAAWRDVAGRGRVAVRVRSAGK